MSVLKPSNINIYTRAIDWQNLYLVEKLESKKRYKLHCVYHLH